MLKPIDIDGAFGEGGGQILRTSLALSLVTGTPFRIRNIRAARAKPGLRKQHLAAVRAAVAVGRAQVSGDDPGSSELAFQPRGCFAGDYTFEVGSAGSCGLVLQTVLPALLMARHPSRLQLGGGTHNPFAPPYHFLQRTFLPLLNRMGPRVRSDLQQWGFYPAGGGRVGVDIIPAPRWSPLDLLSRGDLIRCDLQAILAGLPRHIADRECRAFNAAVSRPFDARVEELPATVGPGNVLMATIEHTHITEVFSAFGRRGVSAENVATELAKAVNTYLATDAPVGPHLADQLLIPSALAGRGRYRTTPPTRHSHTNVAVIGQFLPVPISVQPVDTEVWEIRLGDWAGKQDATGAGK
jgi:RNA 3'-terminal phosphate cyclase (ATP)